MLRVGAAELFDRVYGPIRPAGERLLAGYAATELRFIVDFLDAGRRLQLEQAERIRSLRIRSPALDAKRGVRSSAR